MDRNKYKIITGLSILTLLVFSLPPAAGVPSADKNINVENDQIALRITGGLNVPQYSFWAVGQNDTKYQVKFNRLFEVVDSDGDGTYDKGTDSMVPSSNEALAAMNWEFSEIVDEDGVIKFNISSVGVDFLIQFRNYLDSNTAELKFDVIIDNYSFVNDDSNVLLVLGFHLLGDRKAAVQEQNRVRFGSNGYFESENNATVYDSSTNTTSSLPTGTIPATSGVLDDNSTEETEQPEEDTIGVEVSEADEEGNPMAYLAFEHFDGRVELDPSIGISSDTLSSIPAYPIVGFSIMAIIGVYAILRRRR